MLHGSFVGVIIKTSKYVIVTVIGQEVILSFHKYLWNSMVGSPERRKRG